MAAAMGQGRKNLKEFGHTNSLLQAKKDRDAEDVMAKIEHSSMFAGVNDSEEAKEKVYEFFEKKNTKLEYTKVLHPPPPLPYAATDGQDEG
jgi:hypothetical protein